MAIDPVIKHYFDVLGIQPTTNKTAIKKAYMQKALQLHPDKSGDKTSEAAFKMIVHAWEVLSEHQVSQTDVQGAAHGIGDTGSHSADEVQALMRERDSLKHIVEQQADMKDEHDFKLKVRDMAYERLSDERDYLARTLERETDVNCEQFLQLQQEKTAYVTLSQEWQSLQRTVQKQDTANYNQGWALLQQKAEVRALTAKIAMQAMNHEECVSKLQVQAGMEQRALADQLDYYLSILSLVIFVFALGAAGSWFLDGDYDVEF